jgi:membrane fusion protein (multidrug efflux system)
VKNNVACNSLDNASNALETAGAQANSSSSSFPMPDAIARQYRTAARAVPPYAQAKAKLDEAERNLDHSVMRAPMAGVATQSTRSSSAASSLPAYSRSSTCRTPGRRQSRSDFTYIAVGQPSPSTSTPS